MYLINVYIINKVCFMNNFLSSSFATSIPLASVVFSILYMIFGNEGELSYCGFDADASSGSLTLNRHDGLTFSTPYDDEASSEGFLFENIAKGGLGPESLQTFVNACLGEKNCWRGCDPEIGVKSVRIVDAFYRSAKSKRMELV